MPTVADAARVLKMRAARRRGPAPGLDLPALFLMSDEARLPDPVAALARLPPGAAVILRHYRTPERAGLARRLVALARRRRILVLVAGDWRLAVRVGAAGVHLPEAALKAPLSIGGAIRAKNMIVTIAAHSLRAVFLAGRRKECAAVLLGPIFATASHPGRRALGPLRLAAFCRQSPVPVIALGGIDARSVARIGDSGAAGIAGIGGIVGASGPARARKVLARKGRLV